MNFGQAIEALKLGKSMQRAGWNGKGMCIYLVGEEARTWQFRAVHVDGFVDRVLEFEPCIVMLTANKKLRPWLASQADMLANDWQEVSL